MSIRIMAAVAGLAATGSALAQSQPVDLTLGAAGGLSTFAPPPVTDGCSSDDFNRPDGPIGGAWGASTGSFGNWTVSGNRGRHTLGTLEAITHATASEPFAGSVQVLDVKTVGTGLQYIALMGGLGGAGNIFIKVQEQSSTGMFNTCGFYTGNNGSPWLGMTGGAGFFTLNAPFAEGRLTVRVDPAGDQVTLEIDSDFNGTPDQIYTRGGAAVIGAGTGFGLGAYGEADFDNWATCEATQCYPDCNQSGSLTIADFACFQAAFAAGQPYGDCNNSGTLTIADFACFQAAFATGCP